MAEIRDNDNRDSKKPSPLTKFKEGVQNRFSKTRDQTPQSPRPVNSSENVRPGSVFTPRPLPQRQRAMSDCSLNRLPKEFNPVYSPSCTTEPPGPPSVYVPKVCAI